MMTKTKLVAITLITITICFALSVSTYGQGQTTQEPEAIGVVYYLDLTNNALANLATFR